MSRGKVDISANLYSKHKLLTRKILETLHIDHQKDVHFNAYGYSSLISGLKINLCAIARDYSICYCIDKENFLSAACENSADFEYFHEIRSKIEESSCK